MADAIHPQVGELRRHFEKAATGLSLTEEEAKEAFTAIMQGEVSEIELADFWWR